MKRSLFSLYSLAVILLLVSGSAWTKEKNTKIKAAESLPPYVYHGNPKFAYSISDHMVLQRNAIISLWGFAEPGSNLASSGKI